MATHGIHHVTAIAGDAQTNVNFYAGILGLRIVKRTVNFDDPMTYHLYYGDDRGSAGTIMTFFPWSSRGLHGRIGRGQLSVTAFSIPGNSLEFWIERLKQHRLDVTGPFTRLGEQVIEFRDPDGLRLELIATAADTRDAWEAGQVPERHAIRGFHSVSLLVADPEPTAALMAGVLGFREAASEDGRVRYESGQGGPGAIADLIAQPEEMRGTMGVGTVHHVAWRLPDDERQLALRRTLVERGIHVSPVMDRHYFHSIYFREPGGILFEGATDQPGFLVDESLEQLGTELKLPPMHEEKRSVIEGRLAPLRDPDVRRGGGL